MKNLKFHPKGFTLIELLVVVLILGILAAVALPQYQKVVEKARLAEAVTNIASIEKALDLYVLEHGYKEVYFFQPNNTDDLIDKLDIELESSLDCSKDVQGCYSKMYAYQADCFGGGCSIFVTRLPGDTTGWYTYDGGPYTLRSERNLTDRQWTHSCNTNSVLEFEGNMGENVCKMLKAQGWAD